MRSAIVFCLLSTGCASVQEGYRKSFDTSFMKSCLSSAQGKGATERQAKTYCECALKRVNSGEAIEKAAEECKKGL